MVRVPVRGPRAVGVKVMVIGQVELGARVVGGAGGRDGVVAGEGEGEVGDGGGAGVGESEGEVGGGADGDAAEVEGGGRDVRCDCDADAGERGVDGQGGE